MQSCERNNLVVVNNMNVSLCLLRPAKSFKKKLIIAPIKRKHVRTSGYPSAVDKNTDY